MAKFASSSKQANSVVEELKESDAIKSLGTARNYEAALGKFCEYAKESGQSLRDMTSSDAKDYLEARASEVSQSTLDQERQAIQCMMQNVSNKLDATDRLERTKSEIETKLECRTYTKEQIELVLSAMSERNALAAEICHNAGLRAHEVATIQRVEERQADERPEHDDKFRDNTVKYTVVGKGGLCREVAIRSDLAERLEERRLETHRIVSDREINYKSSYDIGSGKNLSASFSRASERILEWSRGLHGLRHSYAQERMSELQMNHTRQESLEIVSQELGHFRAEITETYLR